MVRKLVYLISGALFGALFVLVTDLAGGTNGGQTISIPAGIYCDTSGVCLSVGGITPTPIPSPTDTPTQSPPTLTPVPVTVTPQPPTDTPQPTPTPEVGRCWGTVNTHALNVRSGPGTTYAILRQVANGDTLYIESKSDNWYQIWDETGQGWVFAQYVTISSDALCSFGPAVLAWHAVPGSNLGEMRISWALLLAKGIPFGVKAVSDVSLCQAAHDMGGVCIYRSVLPSDCPNVDNPNAVQEARLFLLSLSPYINPALPYASFIEPVNECRYDPELWSWWNTFTLEAVRLAGVYHWPPLIVPTFGPGWPELDMLNTLAPALRAVRDSGGLLGLHAYSIYADAPLCAYNQWLSYRHLMIQARLAALGLGDLGLALTEVARADGTYPPIDSDIACYYEAARDDPAVRFIAFWTAGKVGHWTRADLEGHVIAISQIITSAH